MHWIPLILVFVGIAAIVKALLMEPGASFDDGSFLVAGFTGAFGVVCIIVAIVTFLVQWALS